MEANIEPLVRIAAELRDLPRAEFQGTIEIRTRREKDYGYCCRTRCSRSPGCDAKIDLQRCWPRRSSSTQKAFGAKEIFRFEVGGGIPHAEIKIGDSPIMLSREWPEGGRFSAETLGHSPVELLIRVDDVDSFAARAVAAGMTVLRPIKDQFYGSREGSFVDPFGYTWNILTVKEEMSAEEMHRRINGHARARRRQSEAAR